MASKSSANGPSEYEQRLIPLESGPGRALFASASADSRAAHSLLIAHFEPQLNGGACGLACVAMALNSLLEGWPGFEPPLQQEELLKALATFDIAPTDLHNGITLQQLALLAQCALTLRIMALQPSVVLELVQDPGALAVEQRLLRALNRLSPRQFVIANFLRKVGSHHGGHFSPLSALSGDPTQPQALVLDVNPNRLGPHWLPVHFLARSMVRKDHMSNLPRGFLVVSLQDSDPATSSDEPS